MKTLIEEGGWKNPDTGVETKFQYEYPVIESIEEAVEYYKTEAEVCRHITRRIKTDIRNAVAASEKQKAGFGAPKMTEEEKAANKAQRAAKNVLFNAFKDKTRDELEAMGVPEEVIVQLGL
jgi:hypothetical protein